VTSLPPGLAIDEPASPSPEAILATCVGKHQGGPVEEWLIPWKSQPVEEALWEVAASINIQG